MYKIPAEHFQRIHHSRPRFKNNQESVLIFIATEISKLNTLQKQEFIQKLNNSIRLFPGNSDKKLKTINNWRTEISSFFGFIQINEDNTEYSPSTLAKKLANEQDLIQFYKYFLFYFQYPGGHLKSQTNLEFIKQGIKFKPAKYILQVLEKGEELTKQRFFLNKAEVTHCIFNDLRVTRDYRTPEKTVELILQHRKQSEDFYDWSGDIIRYAGDIIDYMKIANLLVSYDEKKFYLNKNEKESIASFIESEQYCNIYDSLYDSDKGVLPADISKLTSSWFDYVNTDLGDELFKTDLYKFLGIKESTYETLVQEAINDFNKQIDNKEKIKTKDIGDFGEGLILGHEKMRMKAGGRNDLLHLIQKIPTQFAMGYDIQSVELNEIKRYIEVKTTISSKKISFHNFHLTPNEWNAAATLKERYFVYRLAIYKEGTELSLIQDPVGLYKNDMIEMSPRDGADMTFTSKASKKEELLIWAN